MPGIGPKCRNSLFSQVNAVEGSGERSCKPLSRSRIPVGERCSCLIHARGIAPSSSTACWGIARLALFLRMREVRAGRLTVRSSFTKRSRLWSEAHREFNWYLSIHAWPSVETPSVKETKSEVAALRRVEESKADGMCKGSWRTV